MKRHYFFIFCLLSIHILCAMEKESAPAYSATPNAPFEESHFQQKHQLQQQPPSHATGNTTLQVFVGSTSSTEFNQPSVAHRTAAWEQKESKNTNSDQKLRYRTTGPLATGTPAHTRISNTSNASSSGCSSFQNSRQSETEENESDIEDEIEYPDDMEVLPGSGITFSGRTDDLLAALKNLCDTIYQQAESLHQQAQNNVAASNGVIATYRTQQYATSPSRLSKILPGATERHASNVAKKVGDIESLQDKAQKKQIKHFRAAMVAAFARLTKIQESMDKRSTTMDLRATEALGEIQAACAASSTTSPMARRRTFSGSAGSPLQTRKNSVERSTSVSPSLLSSSPPSATPLLPAGKPSPKAKSHERKKSDTTFTKPWEKK